MNVNTVVISGRLTADSELKYTQQELAVANFRLAANDRRSDHTSFVNVVCFGKQAEGLNEYLVKGRLICVTGRLKVENYEDKEGNKRVSVSIIAEDIQLGPRAAGSEEAKPEAEAAEA